MHLEIQFLDYIVNVALILLDGYGGLHGCGDSGGADC